MCETNLFDDNGNKWSDKAHELDRRVQRAIEEILDDYPDANMREVGFILASASQYVVTKKLAQRSMARAEARKAEREAEKENKDQS